MANTSRALSRLVMITVGFASTSLGLHAEPARSSAATAPVRAGLSVYPALSFGTAKELVYDGSYLLSELDWPLQPVWSVGTKLSIDTNLGLFATVDLVSGISGNAGIATDSDFLNYNGVKTNYSQSTGLLERSLTIDARAGWLFPLIDGLSAGMFGRFQTLDIKWSGLDGYYQYPPETAPPYTPWSASEPQVPLYGPVIAYEQAYLIPALGVTIRYAPTSVLSLTGSFSYSPFASISDIDNHLLRSLIFYDSMTGCSYLEPDVTVTVRPTDRFTVTFGMSFLSVTSRANGNTVIEDTTTGITQSAGAGSYSGASIQAVTATLSTDLSF